MVPPIKKIHQETIRSMAKSLGDSLNMAVINESKVAKTNQKVDLKCMAFPPPANKTRSRQPTKVVVCRVVHTNYMMIPGAFARTLSFLSICSPPWLCTARSWSMIKARAVTRISALSATDVVGM